MNLLLIFINLLYLFLIVNSVDESKDSKENVNNNNNNKKKITKLQIGVKKRVENCEKKSSKGDIIHIHYRGTLYENGAEFDNSYKRGNPLIFTLGMGQVIAGWDQGLLSMCAGEKRKLVIPSDLAYGSAGVSPTIPPDATLVFQVECVKIETRKQEL